jgi:uncharacterized protein
MSRIIFWLALVFLVIFAVRSKIREAQKRGQQQFRQPPPEQPAPPSGSAYKARSAEKAVADAETMLQCAHCGVFYPASENVQVAGRDYCSPAHAGLPAA